MSVALASSKYYCTFVLGLD